MHCACSVNKLLLFWFSGIRLIKRDIVFAASLYLWIGKRNGTVVIPGKTRTKCSSSLHPPQRKENPKPAVLVVCVWFFWGLYWMLSGVTFFFFLLSNEVQSFSKPHGVITLVMLWDAMRICLQDQAEPAKLKPMNSEHCRFAVMNWKISGKQEIFRCKTWHRVRLWCWLSTYSIFSSCISCLFSWINFRVDQVRAGPAVFQVLSLTHLLDKNGNTLCTCLINICMQRNVEKKKGKQNTDLN